MPKGARWRRLMPGYYTTQFERGFDVVEASVSRNSNRKDWTLNVRVNGVGDMIRKVSTAKGAKDLVATSYR